jgi:hypothetical protein
MYAHARNLLVGQNLDLGVEEIRAGLRVYMPASTWRKGMDFSAAEADEFEQLIDHCSFPLFLGHGLIDKGFGGMKEADRLSRFFEDRDFPEGGIVFTLSPRGIELFTFAHGHRTSPETTYLSPEADFGIEADVALSKGVVLLRDLPLRQER